MRCLKRKMESNSVGYKTDYEMFSMDFEEFLWAKVYDGGFVDDLLEHMQMLTPFSEKFCNLSHGIKFAGGTSCIVDNIYTFPYFCAFLLKRYLKSENGITS